MVAVRGFITAGWYQALLAAAVVYVCPAAAQQPVDLELVLAVDISSSVSRDEYALQMGGLAAAFRDPAVVAAIARNSEAREAAGGGG